MLNRLQYSLKFFELVSVNVAIVISINV